MARLSCYAPACVCRGSAVQVLREHQIYADDASDDAIECHACLRPPPDGCVLIAMPSAATAHHLHIRNCT